MTSQGSAHGRFTRTIQTRNLWAAESALRELESAMPADSGAVEAVRPSGGEQAEVVERVEQRHVAELECGTLALAESLLALAALGSLRAGDQDALATLHRLLRRVQPTLIRRIR